MDDLASLIESYRRAGLPVTAAGASAWSGRAIDSRGRVARHPAATADAPRDPLAVHHLGQLLDLGPVGVEPAGHLLVPLSGLDQDVVVAVPVQVLPADVEPRPPAAVVAEEAGELLA